MKRIVSLFTLLLFVCILSACNKEEQVQEPGLKQVVNTIAESELTEREKSLLSATSEVSFVFDFNVDETFKQASVWVDRYEFGQLEVENINHLTTTIDKKGLITFFTTQVPGNEDKSIFKTFANGSGSTTLQKMERAKQGYWESNPNTEIPMSGEKVLAVIIFSNGNGMSSLPEDFYEDVENNLDQIKDYDAVYVLRSEFIK
ncbi:hypothetical protein [Psychrobacillus sp.]|uniref:hypothetical protein n=1 Tax=Psychrobacillus sp. TaxID=1871623 RepID=UPI0028BE9517|nr:hypothetical protein [Psychrobacillus sp.]